MMMVQMVQLYFAVFSPQESLSFSAAAATFAFIREHLCLARSYVALKLSFFMQNDFFSVPEGMKKLSKYFSLRMCKVD